MTSIMRKASKFIVVGVSALAFAGAAQAGSCVSMQKELGVMGKELVGLQAERDETVATFEVHNNERAAARAELANLKTGIIKMTKEEKSGYETSVEEHNTAAEAAKLKLDELNTSLMEKAGVYNEKTEAFNKKCLG